MLSEELREVIERHKAARKNKIFENNDITVYQNIDKIIIENNKGMNRGVSIYADGEILIVKSIHHYPVPIENGFKTGPIIV
jgi:hypothetical protein